MKNRRNVFRPGFSTKERGWGLGLSLTKRIISDIHGGKISIKDSSPKEELALFQVSILHKFLT